MSSYTYYISEAYGFYFGSQGPDAREATQEEIDTYYANIEAEQNPSAKSSAQTLPVEDSGWTIE